MSISEQLKLADAYMMSDSVKRSTPHEFNARDKVWLSTEHLHLRNQPSRKFNQRFIGPYTITTKVSSNAYQLQLPDTMKCHDVPHLPITTVQFIYHTTGLHPDDYRHSSR